MENENIYRIGVISDTHDRWHPSLSGLLSGLDEIWHLGDVCHPNIIDELESIGTKLTVVLGNNDYRLEYPLTRTLERFGETFYLVHIQPRQIPTGIDWLLCGHTHIPEQLQIGKVKLLNPGTAGGRNKGAGYSLAYLTKAPGERFTVKIQELK